MKNFLLLSALVSIGACGGTSGSNPSDGAIGDAGGVTDAGFQSDPGAGNGATDGGVPDSGGSDGGGVQGSGETVSTMVDARGGTIELTNLTLVIPAGAIEAPTQITITETTTPTPAGYRAFSPLYRFEPEGLTFAEPITVSIRHAANQADRPLATLFWSQGATTQEGFERVGGLPSTDRISGQVHHFSHGFIADGVDYTEVADRACVRTRVLDLRTLPPSGVGVFFSMEDCVGRPITDLTSAEVAVFEDGVPVSSEASAQLFEQRGLQVFVTLVIDMSASTQSIKAEVIAAARQFVETIGEPGRGLRDRVQIAVMAFAGEPFGTWMQLHTMDLDRVLSRLDELDAYVPTDAASTNLNGALQQGLAGTQQAEMLFRARNHGGAFSAGYVVLFTDGADTAGRVAAADVRALVDASAEDVVAVALQGSDYNAGALRALVGEEQVIESPDAVTLGRDFSYLAARIAGQVRRSYLLGYCSPKRTGMHSVHVGVAGSETRVAGVPVELNAFGFGGGCSVAMFNPQVVCGDAECGGFGCGACDDRSSACDSASSAGPTARRMCVSQCLTLNHCEGETFINQFGYSQLCDASIEATSCNGHCTNLLEDETNCGICGTRCPYEGSCVAGVCQCDAGDVACEIEDPLFSSHCRGPSHFLTSTFDCGGCGVQCTGAGEACIDGQCACPNGSCGGECREPAFFETLTDCGACGNACVIAGEQCINGDCACPDGQTLCDGACRPPSYFATISNCGACGHACSGGGERCNAGACECPSGLFGPTTLCQGQCQSAMYFQSSIESCGTCGHRCAFRCRAGQCQDPEEVSVGSQFSCARMTDGTVQCWGTNASGQLGDGTLTNRSSPVPVSNIATAVELSAGREHACARLANGAVWCWGANASGQLGDGTTTAQRVPVQATGVANAVEVSAGYDHTCARLSNGSVRCWGGNLFGQLGDGSQTAQHISVEVPELAGALQISAGVATTCARIAGGAVACWGVAAGPVVDGALTNSLVPRVVAGLTTVAEIANGNGSFCARLSNATVRCWGNNGVGQLGDGTQITAVAPVAVVGLTTATGIAMSGYHACASLQSGALQCWGNNDAGQLGDGTQVRSLTPVTVSGLDDTVGISLSTLIGGPETHTCAITADHQVYCWGGNGVRQLGDGTTTRRLTPVAVVW